MPGVIEHKKLIDILVVDDDVVDRRLAEQAMKEPSSQVEFVIHTAGTLAEGLECLKNHSSDLVLLDLGLPDSGGLKTVDKLHQAYPQIPVMVLTGLADEEAGVEAIKRGAIDYITKPFKPEGLRTRIGIVLQIIELQQKLLSLANTDELTGLVNRRHFFDILEREILQAKIKGNSLAVMMFDIDHFKNINDAYGHLGGDAVLKQMGKILQENIYPLDVAARYGKTVIMEPRVGEIICSSDSMLRLIKDVGRSNFKANFDTAHFQAQREILPITLEKLKGEYANFHIADNNPINQNHIAIGEGTIDWEEFFRLLLDHGYDGYLGIDLSCKDTIKDDLQKSVKELKSLSEKFGFHLDI